MATTRVTVSPIVTAYATARKKNEAGNDLYLLPKPSGGSPGADGGPRRPVGWPAKRVGSGGRRHPRQAAQPHRFHGTQARAARQTHSRAVAMHGHPGVANA